jgi:hypothetical protein
MEKYVVKAKSDHQSRPKPGEAVYIGIDQGLNKWVYAIRWGGEQRQSFAGPSELGHLQALVKRFAPNEVHIAHEACGFGYQISRWAQDCTDHVVRVTVVPPSTIEQQPGLRVKTDRIDARKLARKLEQGELKQHAHGTQGRPGRVDKSRSGRSCVPFPAFPADILPEHVFQR